jgi:hypothetical protein
MEKNEFFEELDPTVLGKILKQVLRYYYMKNAVPSKFGVLRGPEEILVKNERKIASLFCFFF